MDDLLELIKKLFEANKPQFPHYNSVDTWQTAPFQDSTYKPTLPSPIVRNDTRGATLEDILRLKYPHLLNYWDKEANINSQFDNLGTIDPSRAAAAARNAWEVQQRGKTHKNYL